MVKDSPHSKYLCPLRRPRRAILTSGVVIVHDNAIPINAVVTQQLLEQFKWDESDHPEYNPDIVTSDFHLFPELKNWLGGQSFQKMGLNLALNLSSHITGGNVLRRGDLKPGPLI
ncbi:hypothetical protein AVEN_74469-1 [Araneus ventricosus]|uniref:Histone-lysine N-methyltransferase SETMAR n=1 Tax=Araneus ventricosus TaxID=182803 RepID=A0A4Y2PT88_ARAVE|nr:hypothetical protein AVEN_74469-1 [Araneus ventricosus]